MKEDVQKKKRSNNNDNNNKMDVRERDMNTVVEKQCQQQHDARRTLCCTFGM